MYKSKAFQLTVWLLLIFLIILIGQQISFIFRPIVVFITSIFLPVFFSGLLYYLFKPIVKLLMKFKFSKTAAILSIYLIFIVVIGFIMFIIIPVLHRQLLNLINNAPDLLVQLQEEIISFQDSALFERIQQLAIVQEWQNIDYTEIVDNVVNSAITGFGNIAGFVANFLMTAFTIPFILFYMLKDADKLPEAISKYLPKAYRQESKDIFAEMGNAISLYIQGQLIVCLFVGVFVYIGYLIVGLEYALLLAVVAGVTNVVPYFGPVVGTIPGLIVALIQSPVTALQLLVVVIVVQQLESQLVSPQVLGRKLSIHPVAIIFALLTGGSLAGILGFILAVPTYAVGRVIVTHLYALIKKKVEPI